MPLQATSGAASYDAFGGGVPVVPNYIEDVFSTWLYTGNGSTQIISNGIALGTGGSGTGGSGQWTSTSYLTGPSNSAFTFGAGDFTIEFWMFPASSGQIATIFDLKGTNYYTARPMVYQYNQQVKLFWYDGGGNVVSTDYLIEAGKWQHIAVTRSGNTFRIFYNGVLQQTATNTSSLDSSTPTIGQSIDGNDWPYKGYISNLRVVKGTAVYTSNFTPSTTPLTAISGTSLLTLQDPSPFIDRSSNNFSLTMTGSIAASGAGPFVGSVVGKGGLVWQKNRSAAGYDHVLTDTTTSGTGALTNFLSSNTTNSFASNQANIIGSYNSNGFTLNNGSGYSNNNGVTAVSWTFRKQPKFFDVVTYTGNGTTNNVSHALNSTPGFIIIKKTSGTGDWIAICRKNDTQGVGLYLNSTAGNYYNGTWPFGIPPADSTTLKVSWINDQIVGGCNDNGATYVAYLFAHNAGGFGLTGTDNVISCGSFTGSGAGVATTVTLGYEPQFIIAKRTDAAQNWIMFDNMRGFNNTDAARLFPNLSNAESTVPAENYFTPTATGFKYGPGNSMGDTANIIYIAIRRGPMKVPTDGTKVYSANRYQYDSSYTGGLTTSTVSGAAGGYGGFPTDMVINTIRNQSGDSNRQFFLDRLRGITGLWSTQTYAEASPAPPGSNAKWDNQLGVTTSEGPYYVYPPYSFTNYFFRRAPQFFDEVCYIGTGSATTQTHNLGVVPELIIAKRRDDGGSWGVYSQTLSLADALVLNSTTAAIANGGPYWNSTAPTSTVFSLGTAGTTNLSGGTYVAYLFATCPGVSKVGSYTGTGATQTINCGFTGGARFVMIKRTDSTGDWLVWDTVSGMVAGTDNRIAMNTTAAEANNNWVYTASTGFQIVTSDASVNASSGTYIFLSVA
jgi:hypothetical protein